MNCFARQTNFKLSSTKNEGPPGFSSGRRKTLKTLFCKPTKRVTGSTLILPAEMLLHIADYLPICDIAAFALAAKAFAPLRYSWDLLDLPHNKSQRLRFLQKFDALNPSWPLCRLCLKYHCWTDHVVEHRQWALLIHLTPTMILPQSYWELVKRARHYQDSRFGRPIKSLEMKASFDGWLCTTEARFDKYNQLIVRVSSTVRIMKDMFDVPRLKDIQTHVLDQGNILDSVVYCGCGLRSTRDKVGEYCEATLEEIRTSNHIHKALERPDIWCMCGVVYEIRSCWDSLDPKNIGCLEVVRYCNVGEARHFTGSPVSWVHDVEDVDVYDKHDDGLFNLSQQFFRTKPLRDEATLLSPDRTTNSGF